GQDRAQRLDLLGSLPGQVPGFGRIVREVVQLDRSRRSPGDDQLPVAAEDSRLAAGVPVQSRRGIRDGVASQERSDIPALQPPTGREVHSAQTGERGEYVEVA